MMRWFTRPRFTERQIRQAIADAAVQGQRRALATSIDHRLAQRREGRAKRQADARAREAAKLHERFVNDPLVQATRR